MSLNQTTSPHFFSGRSTAVVGWRAAAVGRKAVVLLGRRDSLWQGELSFSVLAIVCCCCCCCFVCVCVCVCASICGRKGVRSMKGILYLRIIYKPPSETLNHL